MELRKQGQAWLVSDEVAVTKSKEVKLRGEGSMLKLTADAQLMGPQISLCKPESVDDLEDEERELTTIELTDEQGEPCPHQRYILVFEDGSEQTGVLDENGTAERFQAIAGQLLHGHLAQELVDPEAVVGSRIAIRGQDVVRPAAIVAHGFR